MKIFHSIDFPFKRLLESDNDVSCVGSAKKKERKKERQKDKMGVVDFVSVINRILGFHQPCDQNYKS